MKPRIKSAAVPLLLFVLIGCAAKQTSQYNAAVVSNDFAHAMGVMQTEVINLHNQQLMSDTGYSKFKSVAVQANSAGLSADKLIATGDWNGAMPLLTSALNVLRTIPATTMGIADPNSQLLYAASLNAAIATLEITIATGMKKTGSPAPAPPPSPSAPTTTTPEPQGA